MATQVEKLIVELTAKVDKYLDGVDAAKRATAESSKRMQDDINGSLTAILGFSRVGSGALLKFSSVVASALSVRAIKQYADAWRFAQNRLRIVTEDQDDLASVSRKVVDAAIESRVTLEATALLYSRMARTTKDLNLTQADLARITETINKSFVVSGATAAEATSSIIQLSQAFARGVLRGDEFRSVSEQAPVILEAVTAATGKNRGALIELAEQGLLTSELLIGSLQRYEAQVDETFGRTIPTIDQAFTNLQTSIKEYVGTVDSASGITETTATNIINFGKSLRGLQRPTIDILDGLKEWAKQWELVFGDDARTLLDDFSKKFEQQLIALRSFTDVTLEFIVQAFADLPGNIKAVTEIATVESANLFEQGKALIQKAGLSFVEAQVQGAGQITEELEAQIALEREGIEENAGAFSQARLDRLTAIVTENEARKKAFEERLEEIRKLRDEEDKPGQPGQQVISPPSPVDIGEEDKAADAFITRLRTRQQKLDDANLSEIEAIRVRFQRENELLIEKLDTQKITEAQFAEQFVELEREKIENIRQLSLSEQDRLLEQQFLEIQNLVDARDQMMVSETQFEERRTALRIKHANEQISLTEKVRDVFITRLRTRQQELDDANLSEIESIRSRFQRENELLIEKLDNQKITEAQFAEQFVELEREKIENIRQLSLSEQDRLLEQQFLEVQNLIDARDQMMISETQFEERRTALRIKHANEQIKLADRVRKAEVSIEGQKSRQIIGILKGLASGHKDIMTAIFIAEKAVAIAQIFIRTKEAAALALATIPPPVGFGVAAGIEAKGALDMALVAATAIGGVAAASGGGGGGGTGGAIALPETAADTGDTAETFEKRISATISDEEGITSEQIRVIGIDGSKFEDFLVALLNDALINDRGQGTG